MWQEYKQTEKHNHIHVPWFTNRAMYEIKMTGLHLPGNNSPQLMVPIINSIIRYYYVKNICKVYIYC